MDDILAEGRAIFEEEARDLIAEIESLLMDIDGDLNNLDIIGAIFRAMHTLKGSGAMFGFDNIASFTHSIENVYDDIRNSKLEMNTGIVDYTLKSLDIINLLLIDEMTFESGEIQNEIKNFFSSLIEHENGEITTDKNIPTETIAKNSEKSYRIRFIPDKKFMFSGSNPKHLLEDLEELGICTISANSDELIDLEYINPEELYIFWDIVLITSKTIDDIKDIFIFVEDSCELTINEIDLEDDNSEKLGNILVQRGDVNKSEIDAIFEDKPKIGEVLVEKGLVSETTVKTALKEQSTINEKKSEVKKKNSSSNLKVSIDKMDKVVNLVGELVTFQARMNQLATEKNDSDFLKVVEDIEHLTIELRETTMNMRMVQVSNLFNKFRRLVRDLSNKLNKEVVLETIGDETELDKTVIDKLNDPLVHMIRNCIDHGLETPEIREETGKPAKGTVKLVAEHAGTSVLIHVIDDGKGLNVEQIRQKGIDKGFISTDDILEESEIFELIFAPGFSTNDEISDISGRGVGMDVVKKNIEALRGSIHINSKLGEGTKFTLKLPLTLAIIDGLLVKIANDNYIIPLLSVEECIEYNIKDTKEYSQVIMIRGEAVPIINLQELLNIDPNDNDIKQLAVINVDGKRVGFLIDKIIGEHQTVIKNLGQIYTDLDYISGATILGDGDLALILDLFDIYKKIQNKL